MALSDTARRMILAELGEDGLRALSFLDAAESIRANDSILHRRWETFAYTLRESLTTLTWQGQEGDRDRDPARELNSAIEDFESDVRAGMNVDEAMQSLRAYAERLERHRLRPSRASERLVASLYSRMGSRMVAGGEARLGRFAAILATVNGGLHRSFSADQAEHVWTEVIPLIEALFDDPADRGTRLEQIATLHEPKSQDAASAYEMINSDADTRRFLLGLRSPSWLDLLVPSGIVREPSGEDGWWAGQHLTRSLAEYPESLALFSRRCWEDFGRTSLTARTLARFASTLGVDSASTMLAIATTFPEEASPWVFRWADDVPVDSPIWPELASVAITSSSLEGRYIHWSKFSQRTIAAIAGPHGPRVFSVLIEKLKESINLNEVRVTRYVGSVLEIPRHLLERGGTIVLHMVAHGIEHVAGRVHWSDLESMIRQIPAPAQTQLLARAASVSSDLSLEDAARVLADIVRNEFPTIGLAAAPDRLLERFGESLTLPLWAALGTAPSAHDIESDLAANATSGQAWHVQAWSEMLPEPPSEWSRAFEAMKDSRTPFKREDLVRSSDIETEWERSGLDAQEIEDAAAGDEWSRIRDWRPLPGQRMTTARSLGVQIAESVKRRPDLWTRDAPHVVRELEHPTYVEHFVRALANRDTTWEPTGAVALKVASAVEGLKSKPVADLGGNRDWDYATSWDGSWAQVIALIERVANVVDSNDDFAGDRARAWEIVLAEAANTSDTRRGVLGDDPLARAINRPATQAFEAALALMGLDFRTDNEVSATGLRLLDLAMAADGMDGEEYRALIVTHLRFLDQVAPVWLQENADKLLGESAGVQGRAVVDMALTWSTPPEWLFERFGARVRDSVRRGVEHADIAVLITMLRGVAGYEPAKVSNLISRSDEVASKAGISLANLLDDENVEAIHLQRGIAFWTDAIADFKAEHLTSFGLMAEVPKLNSDVWLDLTLQTLSRTEGKLQFSDDVADRLNGGEPSESTLAAFDLMIRASDPDYSAYRLLESAQQHLALASGLRRTAQFRRLEVAVAERQ